MIFILTSTCYTLREFRDKGAWSPQNSALPWIRFCLAAHDRQARTVLRRIRELEALWDACEQLARRHRPAPRTVGALVDAARGWRLRRSLYVAITKATADEAISDAAATSNLAAMVRAPQSREARHHPTRTPDSPRDQHTITAWA